MKAADLFVSVRQQYQSIWQRRKASFRRIIKNFNASNRG